MHVGPHIKGEQDTKEHTCWIGICHMQDAVGKPKYVLLNMYHYELS